MSNPSYLSYPVTLRLQNILLTATGIAADDYAASTATKGTLPVNASVSGNIETGQDSDWYSVMLTAGQTYQIDAEGRDTRAGTLLDTYLQLRDSAGVILTENDDDGTGLNSLMVFQASTSGIHYLSVSAYGVLQTGSYRLTLTDLPLVGTVSDDVLQGNAAGNALEGLGGNDSLSGLDGNDSLTGGIGDDTLDGGTGSDTVDYSSAASAVLVRLAGTTAHASGGAGTDSLQNIEHVNGSNFDDTLVGSGRANQLVGNDGDDILNGAGGVDTMEGGAGDDRYTVDDTNDQVTELIDGGIDTVFSEVKFYFLPPDVENLRITNTGTANGTGNELDNVIYAGQGNNILNGANGNDTASFAFASASVNASLNSRSATGASGLDLLLYFENLEGSKYQDKLTGSTRANNIDGGMGKDTLLGAANNDTLTGGRGNDVLRGGQGQDSLEGGLGADRFDYDALDDSLFAASAWDLIADFNPAQGDRIDLASLDADNSLAGHQAFTFVGNAEITAASQIRYDPETGMLYANVNADLDAEFAIQLMGAPALAPADLIL
ncbi:MAG: calcium-binding protein [Pseudomonadota bacterium]